MRGYTIMGMLLVSASLAAADDSSLRDQTYRSAFEAYENWDPVSREDWQEANRVVSEAGGWRANMDQTHMRHAPMSTPPQIPAQIEPETPYQAPYHSPEETIGEGK